MVDESKYIRWGIPGWVFITGLLAVALIERWPIELIGFKSATIVGLVAVITVIGVPIGYLFHQLYFTMNWLIIKRDPSLIKWRVNNFPPNPKANHKNAHKMEEYFYVEFLWNLSLSNIADEEKRKYISERYRHLLSYVHGLGALLVGLGATWFFSLFFLRFDNLIIWIPPLIELILIFVVWKNFKYYSDNLDAFQGYFLNHFLEDNKKQE